MDDYDFSNLTDAELIRVILCKTDPTWEELALIERLTEALELLEDIKALLDTRIAVPSEDQLGLSFV